jgi:hypothetical protein
MSMPILTIVFEMLSGENMLPVRNEDACWLQAACNYWTVEILLTTTMATTPV